MLLDEPQGKTILNIGKHKIIWGWFKMEEGFTHMQFGTLLYKGVAVWEYGVYFGVFAVYVRWELPL